jgi:DNA-binding LacI/PurR family transcriptional regulator/putative methionine-R-sulfoxide reductase with GAF domain
LDAAREHGANLLAFAGGILRSPHGFDAQANVLYDLVGAENVDSLVIDGGLLSHYVGPEALQDFSGHYRGLPRISVEVALKGIPGVLVDFSQGMHDVIAHLIEAHGYRRIAFIRGPEESSTGEDRYRAYTDALAEHGIPLDTEIVAPGTFFAPSGAEAIRLLLDKRKVSFEAVAAANDYMAIDAMQALQARGIRVPNDIAVVGFDDQEVAKVVTPPLTTARLHNYERARRATEMLLARLRGEEVPGQAIIRSELVVRQSCGCQASEVTRSAAGLKIEAGEPFEAALAAHQERILAEMIQTAASSLLHLDSEQGQQLLDAFAAGVKGETPDSFLTAWDEILRQSKATGEDITAWNAVISSLRSSLLSCLGDGEARSRAEDMWQQARVMIGLEAQRTQAYQKLQSDKQAGVLRDVGQALATSTDVKDLMDTVVQELPRLGIRSCYLSLYEDPEAPAQQSRLILAYGRMGRVEPEASGQSFPSRSLVPADVLHQTRADGPDQPYSYVVEPLYFRENQIGFVLLEAWGQEGVVCGALRAEISSALWEVMLRQRAERRALRLQTAAQVSRAASSILDPESLIQHVVDLIRERFGLYYVGLFLVDKEGRWTGEPGKWAVLRAGTGEAGRKMMKQRHRLKVGGLSMIGACVASGEARIALDVGEEAVRFDNPLLPETHSEMALPLVSRGDAIGALSIQSSKKAAFSTEDIAVLRIMADQVANAVENARLFKQTQDALEEIETVHRSYLRQAWDQYIKKHSP